MARGDGAGSRGRARAALRAIGRALSSGAVAGAYVMALVFAVELASAAGFQMMGVHDAQVQQMAISRYGRRIAIQQAEVLGFYLAVGALYGAVVDGALRLWARARGRAASRARRFFAAAGGALAIEAWRLAVAVVRYPQLFNDALYGRGGWRRALQVALTEHAPRWAVEAVGWAALAALVLGPLATARGKAWAARAVRRWRYRLLVPPLAVGVIAAAAGRAPSAAPPAPGTPPNLLVIAVDSLRADHVGPGHARVAPHLAALASRGVRFDAAYVSLPRTFPSWVTLLTGRWPQHHGVRTMFPDAAQRRAAGPFLPSLLAARGYRTAVVSDFSGEIFSRLDAGFAVRDVPFFDAETIARQAGLNLHPALVPYAASRVGHAAASSLAAAPDNADPDRLADRVIDTLRRESARGPFFVTAFFSAPHFPYAAPDPWYRRFTSPGYRGPFRYQKPVAVLGMSDAGVTDEDVAQVRALYDGAVAAVDDAVGRILDELSRSGLADHTIVVLLADHGEGLYEPGRGMGHGEHLHGDQVVHIPLVVWDPVHRFPAHAVPGIVRDVDLAPTLAALVGAEVPRADGVDLRPLLDGARASLDLTAYGETGIWFVSEGPGFRPGERLPYPPLPDLVAIQPDDDVVLNPTLRELAVVGKHRIVRDERWKLYYQPTREGVKWSLFDLAQDPDERTDVAAQHPDQLARLQRKLYDWMTLDGSTVENGFVVPR